MKNIELFFSFRNIVRIGVFINNNQIEMTENQQITQFLDFKYLYI